MTREEAIEHNKNLRMYMKLSDKNNPCKFNEENYTALDMATQALEQEPCEDWYDIPSEEMTLEQARSAVRELREKLGKCMFTPTCEDAISRQAVLDIDYNRICVTNARPAKMIRRQIMSLPSVTCSEKPNRWIPVSEGLPEEDRDYLVYGTRYFVPDHVDDLDHFKTIGIVHYSKKFGWFFNDIEEIYAWMPLPELYAGEKEETK